MNPPIFISYSRQDGEFALRLGRDLRAEGVDLWMDQLDIPPGGRWDREVERALKSCRTLIVILSSDAVASENVMDEVGYALAESKRVVPVVCRPCELPFRLQRVQYVDLSTDYRPGLQRLLATLASPQAGDDRAGGVPVQPRPVVDRRRRGTALRSRRIIAVAVAALAIGGGTLWMSSRPRRNVRTEAVTPTTTPPPPATRDAAPPQPVVAATGATVLPFFMTRPLTEADLAGKSAWELDVMRNEIYARHGRRFARSDLQSYFEDQPWYRPAYAPDEFPASLLSAVQKRNVDVIQRYQQRLAR